VKVVFFGTPHFASVILEKLIRSGEHEVVAVVSKPDAQRGRGLHVSPTSVKEVA
jgi:methionyl-tRNA formyltransferase